MRVLEVVADTLHVSVSPDLAASVEEVVGAVVPDDGAAGINLVDNVKHCGRGQRIHLEIKINMNKGGISRQLKISTLARILVAS